MQPPFTCQRGLYTVSDEHFRTCAHGRTCPHVRMWGAVRKFWDFLSAGAVRCGKSKIYDPHPHLKHTLLSYFFKGDPQMKTKNWSGFPNFSPAAAFFYCGGTSNHWKVLNFQKTIKFFEKRDPKNGLYIITSMCGAVRVGCGCGQN